jgi:hypothetical protein
MAVMNRHVRLILSVAAVLATGLPAVTRAQDAEELTWYAVEVIVFERSSDSGRDAELWPSDPGLPDIAGAVELSLEGLSTQAPGAQAQSPPATPGEAPTASATPVDASMPRAFQLLPASQFRLTDTWRRLDKSGAYRPLLHIAWIQPGYTAENARPVHVRNDNAALGAVTSMPGTDPGALPALNGGSSALTLSAPIRVARDRSKAAIDGTFKVHRARYLHVEADLLYHRPLPADANVNDAGSPALPDSPDTALIEQLLAEGDATPRLFRLSESRRMRSRELHYLDHPLFGALVEIWPVELPEPTPVPEAVPAAQDEAKPAEPSPLAPAPGAGASGG